jgi:hypothetical protein
VYVQALRVGLSLRSNYLAATGADSVDPADVTVYSTDFDRTVDTAHALLLGLLSDASGAANATAAATAAQPRHCGCRPSHGTRSPVRCIASCLGLAALAKGALPEVTVRNDSDVSLYQASLCKGWDDWINKVERSSKWTDAPHKRLKDAVAAVDLVTSGETLLLNKRWPGGACVSCTNTSSINFNVVGLLEGVRLWLVLPCFAVPIFLQSLLGMVSLAALPLVSAAGGACLPAAGLRLSHLMWQVQRPTSCGSSKSVSKHAW